MADDIFAKVLVVLVLCSLVFALRKSLGPRTMFKVRIVDGRPETVSGKISSSFLVRIQEVVAANAITGGTITGYAQGRFIRLGFSREIPESAQQQLRNWWASFGWNAPAVGRPTCSS